MLWTCFNMSTDDGRIMDVVIRRPEVVCVGNGISVASPVTSGVGSLNRLLL